MTKGVQRKSWESFPGWELVQEFQDRGHVRDIVPSTAGVYMWKRSLVVPNELALSRQTLMVWLRDLLTSPYGLVRNVSVSHFMQLSGLTLRGSDVPTEKLRSLGKFLGQPRNRQWAVDFVSSLTDHAPALYVGEASDLAKRTVDHLAHETGFGATVEDTPELDFNNMVLYIRELPQGDEFAAEIRKTMEYVTAVLCVAGYTQRPG